jgi:hypothetical protein
MRSEPGLRPGRLEPSLLHALDLSHEIARRRGESETCTAHLIVALAEQAGSPFSQVLAAHGVSPARLRAALDEVDLPDDITPPVFQGPVPATEPGIWPAPDLALVVPRAYDGALARGHDGATRRDLVIVALTAGESDSGVRLLELVALEAASLVSGLESIEDPGEEGHG